MRTVFNYTILCAGLAAGFAVFFGLIVTAYFFLGAGWAMAVFIGMVASLGASITAFFAEDRPTEAEEYGAPESAIVVPFRGRGS